MTRWPIALMTLLASCGVTGEHARGASIAGQMEQHDDYLATERAIEEQLNLPAGPDYAAAVTLVERSNRSALQKDYDIGGLLLSSCRDGTAYCSGTDVAARGVTLLTRVATTPGDDATIAAGDLARWYERGAGEALAPNAARAACWTAARDGKGQPATCATID